jgi:Putative adhesin
MPEWSVTEPQKLTFDTRVSDLQVRIVNGTVNVVGTEESSARLEVSEIEGPPLVVTQQGDTLTVAYEDLPWKGFLKWLDRKGWRRSTVVSLAVPADTRVEVGVVGAGAVVSGIRGSAVVKGVTGDTTLVGVSGPVRADTVSGNVEAQAVTGDLRFNSVSGDLTVVEGSGRSVRADSVSGSMIVDLDPDGPTEVSLTSVSGEIAIRLPHPGDAEVEANTASGTISNAFDGLRVHGQWGAHRITGRLGAGTGRLRATTVSGSIALLRRPPREDEADTPWDTRPMKPSEPPRNPGTAPAAGNPATPGDNSVSGRDSDGTAAPADGTTDKKVL